MAGKNVGTSGNKPAWWRKPPAIYLLVVLVLTLPLLRPGYIFGLDMIFTPTLAMPTGLSHSYLLYAMLHMLNVVLPAMFIQKILLLGTLLLAGLGAHKLIEYARPAAADKRLWRWAAYFGGILYLCNPFTYTRFMVGQYEVLLGYALLPFFALLMWRFFRSPNWKRALALAACAVAISIVSIHTLGMAAILAAVFLVGFIWQRWRDRDWLISTAKWLGLALLTVIIASSYWLVPLMRGDGATSDSIANFTVEDRVAFETSPGELGLVGNVLALQGFWGDDKNLYLLPQDTMAMWWIPSAGLWLLVLVGAVWSWRQRRTYALLFGTILLAGTVLAIGTAGTIFAGFNGWLFDNVPLFAGYREPQKFAALIALAYAFFGGAGVYWLATRIRLPENRKLVAVSLLLPFACAPLFIGGGTGQLEVGDYPKGWYTANRILAERGAEQDKTLFLPWHLYMPYGFAGDVMASPASRFFTSTSILSSRNPELKNAHSYTTNPNVQRLDQNILPAAENNNRLVLDLNTLHIRYILLTKDFDYADYSYLDSKPGITLLHEDNDIKLYSVETIEGGR